MTTLCHDRLFSGGLITNYTCSSACAHCVYRSSPRRQRGTITAELAAEAFRRLRLLGCQSMHIGGGEPFLNTERLLVVLHAARTEGMGIDYIETNCSWFEAGRDADDLLKRLQRAGCHTLLVSIDPFHNGFVPFGKVKGVMAACRRTGMGIFPWRMEFFRDVDHFDDWATHGLEEYTAAFGDDYLASLAERYGLNLGGRALTALTSCFAGISLEETLRRGRDGCRVLENGNHFHVDLYGDFIPTACPGMAVSLDDLGRPLQEDKYPTLTCLFNGGPAALFERACEHGFTPDDAYLSSCDLCDHLRAFLVRHVPEQHPDLRPRDFYDERS